MTKNDIGSLAIFPNAESNIKILEQEFNRIFEAMANVVHLCLDRPHEAAFSEPGIEVNFTWRVRRKETELKFNFGSSSGPDQ